MDNSVLKEKDKLQIALRPAVELSYLSEEEQADLYETIESEDCMPRERIQKYFPPKATEKQIEDTIVKALELYRKRERSLGR